MAFPDLTTISSLASVVSVLIGVISIVVIFWFANREYEISRREKEPPEFEIGEIHESDDFYFFEIKNEGKGDAHEIHIKKIKVFYLSENPRNDEFLGENNYIPYIESNKSDRFRIPKEELEDRINMIKIWIQSEMVNETLVCKLKNMKQAKRKLEISHVQGTKAHFSQSFEFQ